MAMRSVMVYMYEQRVTMHVQMHDSHSYLIVMVVRHHRMTENQHPRHHHKPYSHSPFHYRAQK